MSEYTPDVWATVKVKPDDAEPFYKVLGGWYGGYLYGDSWRMNSGIERIEDGDNVWVVHGTSGSVYRLHKKNQHISMVMAEVLAKLGDKAEVVDIEEIREAL